MVIRVASGSVILNVRMAASAGLGSGLSTSRDDVRITRVGRVLRNRRLDELPQHIARRHHLDRIKALVVRGVGG